jgi:hypothetical protein
MELFVEVVAGVSARIDGRGAHLYLMAAVAAGMVAPGVAPNLRGRFCCF